MLLKRGTGSKEREVKNRNKKRQRIGNEGRFPFNQNVRFAKFSVTSSHLDRALTRAGLNWWLHERCDNILGISMHCGKAIVTPLVQVRVCSLVLRTSPLPSGGSRGENRGGQAPLFLDQTEARRAEKYFFRDFPPSLFQALDDRPPPLIWRSASASAPCSPFLVLSHPILCQGNRMLSISSAYQSKTNYHILS